MPKEVHLDIGCGEGEFFCKLAAGNPQGIYLAMDPVINRHDLENRLQHQFSSDYYSYHSRLEMDTIPSNLCLVKSRCYDQDFPFQDNTIDFAYINFVMDKLRDRQEERTIRRMKPNESHWFFHSTDVLIKRYAVMLNQLKRILKSNAQIFICEPKYNIPELVDLYLREGFIIIQPPIKVHDEEKTDYVKDFYHDLRLEQARSKELGRDVKADEEMKFLPMEFACLWSN